VRTVVLLFVLSTTSLHGCIAEWRGRSEGTVNLTVGMTRDEAQRRSTIPLNTYGDSDHYFDFVLAGEALRFRGNDLYSISWKDGKVEDFSTLSADQTWAEARHDVQRAEALLLERGWKRNQDMEGMSTLPESARAAANAVNYDTSIRRTFYEKGDLQLELTVCGHGKIPWYRIARDAEKFWHSVGVGRR